MIEYHSADQKQYIMRRKHSKTHSDGHVELVKDFVFNIFSSFQVYSGKANLLI